MPAKTAKVCYSKIKNPEVKTGLVPRLYFSDGLYAGNALVKNRSGKAYIKIVNTRDTDERIIASKVELEKLDKIATTRLKNSSLCDKDVQTRAVNAVATEHVQSRRNYSL